MYPFILRTLLALLLLSAGALAQDRARTPIGIETDEWTASIRGGSSILVTHPGHGFAERLGGMFGVDIDYSVTDQISLGLSYDHHGFDGNNVIFLFATNDTDCVEGGDVRVSAFSGTFRHDLLDGSTLGLYMLGRFGVAIVNRADALGKTHWNEASKREVTNRYPEKTSAGLLFAGGLGAEFSILPSVALGIESEFRFVEDGHRQELFVPVWGLVRVRL